MTHCLPCALEDADPVAIVFRDQDWSCEVADGYDVPGWFILRLRRHAEGWAGLSADEAAGFGVISQRIAMAVQEATSSPTAYFMSFGENHRHFHFLVTARPQDLPPESRGAAILARRNDDRDPHASLEVAAAVRNALLTPPEQKGR